MPDKTPQSLLHRIFEICREFRISALGPQVESFQDLLSQEKLIDVAILGRFKAGKSSFLNYLADISFLPTGVVPITTVITRLRYGAYEKAEIRFLDGKILQMKVEGIGSFVTESENPDNQKQVSSVDIEIPSLKTYEGLRFVDTPGLGSIFTHNTEMAREWLPRVGAATKYTVSS